MSSTSKVRVKLTNVFIIIWRGTSGSDEKISATKIQPLDSEIKSNQSRDQSSRVATGTNRSIDQSRIDPLSGAGQYQHTAPHADSQGSVERAETIQGSKIKPPEGKGNQGTRKNAGLDDETVDMARINSVGSVREEQPPA
ncbi:uncharacterized protein A1O5_04912 [Cladophialophora psammophila CBS 110553]|uniref:Uncharacterized protein n=1 Tax=Cladophialophora psammophila CBS 110553 TaxID=1182543 RepID=W9WWW0_9EURO|nr:uncharacterized protein A1O5_04912 [Cladophialophora psammophila CBS 110553]EXJ72408.1 hypothetical protein A1O5_04912 [Cladophialophora psammophila CBS 110553]